MKLVISAAVGSNDHAHIQLSIRAEHELCWGLQLELYGKLDKESSKIAVNARSIVLLIAKEETGFWPRLLRQTGKAPNNIKIDWNKVRPRSLSTP